LSALGGTTFTLALSTTTALETKLAALFFRQDHSLRRAFGGAALGRAFGGATLGRAFGGAALGGATRLTSGQGTVRAICDR